VDRIDLGQDRDQWRVTFRTVNFFTSRATMSFSRILLPGDGRLKVRRQWKQTALQRAGMEPYRGTVEMLLQRNTVLALSEPRYSWGLL
jgi:hypothetical protein